MAHSATLSTGKSFTTSNCFSCLNSYTNVYFCKDQSVSSGYCCESSLSSKTTTTTCLEDTTAPRNCSFGFTSSDLRYSTCFQQDTLCGDTTSFTALTSSYQSIKISDYNYTYNSPCYYEISVSSTDASTNTYYEVYVNYVFASKLYLFTGTSVKTASNKTTAAIDSTYLFPLTSSGSTQKLYMIVYPDSQTLYPPSASFKFKIYTKNFHESNLKYITGTSSAYTGNILIPTILLPLLAMLLVPPAMYIAYLSNKKCFLKPPFVEISKEFKEAGQFGESLQQWKQIEDLMLKKHVNEPPKEAPKVFQIEYLTRLEEIKEVEKHLDRQDVRDKLEVQFAMEEGKENDEENSNKEYYDEETARDKQEELQEYLEEQEERRQRIHNMFSNREAPTGLSTRELNEMYGNTYKRATKVKQRVIPIR